MFGMVLAFLGQFNHSPGKLTQGPLPASIPSLPSGRDGLAGDSGGFLKCFAKVRCVDQGRKPAGGSSGAGGLRTLHQNRDFDPRKNVVFLLVSI